MGGLGNQMFQYATGFAIAKREGVPLKIDLSFLNNTSNNVNHTLRQYELACLNISSSLIHEKQLKKFLKFAHLYNHIGISKIDKILFKNLLSIPKIYSYHGAEFMDDIFEYGSNCMIDGYWQSEKYFNNIKIQLLKEFTFNDNVIAENEFLVSEIKSCTSISLHVRRGDYVTNKDANNFHGTCTLNYYKNAIQYIKSKIANPYFYIFSDEPDWARKNLELNDIDFKIIEGNFGNKSHNDMFLMSCCCHNIIANSSFSWWAAWLNNYSGKIVVAPKQWFSNEIQNNLTKDLIPNTWLRI